MKAEGAGRLRGAVGKPVNADQMQLARLKAEPARTRMERDILKRGGVFREGIAVTYAFIGRHAKV